MRIFTQEIIVEAQDIDIQKRVSNLCYVQWMQDLAIQHSTSVGWSMERYEAVGQSWVVRQHTISYKRPAFLGEVITAATWVSAFAPRQSLRRYLFWRGADKTLLAEAETLVGQGADAVILGCTEIPLALKAAGRSDCPTSCAQRLKQLKTTARF